MGERVQACFPPAFHAYIQDIIAWYWPWNPWLPKDGAGVVQVQAEPLNSDVSKNNCDQEFEF